MTDRQTALGGAARAVSEGQRVSLTIPAKPEYLAVCRLALTALGRWAGVGEDTVSDLKLAVSEALSILIQGLDSADRGDAAGPAVDTPELRLTFDLFADRWVIRVSGSAPDFALPAAAAVDVACLSCEDGQPVSPDSLASETALAVVVITALVDDLAVERAPDGTVVVQMTKAV